MKKSCGAEKPYEPIKMKKASSYNEVMQSPSEIHCKHKRDDTLQTTAKTTEDLNSQIKKDTKSYYSPQLSKATGVGDTTIIGSPQHDYN